uniref:Uncharacterized protein n=1 Tax=Lotharella globosa TaxID=91324 RepID=A0A7S4DXL0_9EUKA|mmetsp:Transcript_4812/g.9389  ORF Transcript_4812/g.9389 Transcript_4812/m.9389 type:complete len:572 (+) Transcript_4812:72-1787(+)
MANSLWKQHDLFSDFDVFNDFPLAERDSSQWSGVVGEPFSPPKEDYRNPKLDTNTMQRTTKMELWSPGGIPIGSPPRSPRIEAAGSISKDIGSWSPSCPQQVKSPPTEGILRGSKRGSLFFDVECDIFGLGCNPLNTACASVGSLRLNDASQTEYSSPRLSPHESAGRSRKKALTMRQESTSSSCTPASPFEAVLLPGPATPDTAPQDRNVRISSKSTFYKGLRYIGPTLATRPVYKSNQKWEWDIYPHGISKQGNKLRVQIKQKGLNPTYPYFPATQQGVLDAAMFRDKEVRRLWENGTLVRVPKYNFEHSKPDRRSRKRRHESHANDSSKAEKPDGITIIASGPADSPADTFCVDEDVKTQQKGRKKRRSSQSEVELWSGSLERSTDEEGEASESDVDCIRYKNLRYIGPTVATRPAYKSNQKWEWDIYPHGISKQGKKLRVQIKQKGLNPAYPYFPNTKDGVFEAALFRDQEVRRLWKNGTLVRVPKFNFEDPSENKPATKGISRVGQKSRSPEFTIKSDRTSHETNLKVAETPLILTNQEDLGFTAAELFSEPTRNIWDQFTNELLG